MLLFNLYDDWLKSYVKNKSSRDDEWENFFVKHLDYIANPTIEVKNKEICAFFVDYIIPFVILDKTLFENIKEKISKLNADCYLLEKVEDIDLHKDQWDHLSKQV